MPLFRMALSLCVAAGMAACAVVAASALAGLGHRWPDILAQFVAPALTVALGLTLVSLIAKAWRLAGAGALVAALLLIALWPQAFPDSGQPRAGAASISLYSANLWARNQDVDGVIASVRQADADVVVLVELGDAVAPRLDEVLTGYPHRVMTPRLERDGGAVRAAIASRFPLEAIPVRADELASIQARVTTPLGPVNIVGVHLTRPWPFQYQWGQIRQVMALSELRNDLEGPVIVAGDFNSVSSSRIGRQVQDEVGLIPAPGWPGTWPSPAPGFLRITIDQVYHSPDLALTGRRLGLPMGSDHRPMVTRFTLAERPSEP